MSIERKLIGTVDATAFSGPAIYVEDVFSTYLYTGTGASQTINNGIDLATKGGLVWLKNRTGTYGHWLWDTSRGAGYSLGTESTGGQVNIGTTEGVSSFTSSGFSMGNNINWNGSGLTAVSWTFRKQPKFFDVVTWTGNGSSSRLRSHALGATPGMIIVKRTDNTGNWVVWHKSLNNYDLLLNSTAASDAANQHISSTSSSSFTVWNYPEGGANTSSDLNASGGTYVAYLFADSNSGGFGPAGTDSVVACGSFTSPSSGQLDVTLGWEPQYLLMKSASAAGEWYLVDNMRGFALTGTPTLNANTSNAEKSVGTSSFDATYRLNPTATGFTIVSGAVPGGATYIYLAIRRGPMKTPTEATKVFAPSFSTSNVGFPVDMFMMKNTTSTEVNYTTSRLQGSNQLTTSSTSAEIDGYWSDSWQSNTGLKSSGGSPYITHMFRRAPGFFDVVCYTGTGSARTVAHNLGVVPELMIVKRRDAASEWLAYNKDLGTNKVVLPNRTDAAHTGNAWFNNVAPTSSVFTVGTDIASNASGSTYVAYLFATCPGVSKVGSYTGSGTTKQIDCGFAAGARFVLIKRTDSTGNWYVWDTARGIVSGNDPYLLLNSTAAEVTNTDYIDPYSAGFEISSTAPAEINASGGTYIYLAIA